MFLDLNSGKDAQKHLLVCPKTHLKDVNSLQPKHYDLVKHMKEKAEDLLDSSDGVRVIDSEAESKETLIGFHVPLSTSIDHLHMHAFKLPFFSKCYQMRKYNSFFFVTAEDVLNRLES